MTTNSTPAEIPTSVSEQQRLDEQWQGVSIQDLASRHLAPFVGENTGRVTYQGQSLLLPPGPAQTLGLALHELVTNAVKYGALSVPTGKVHLAWHQEASRFRMSWIEHDGPPPPSPTPQGGFGSVVLARLTPEALDGQAALQFTPEGVRWTLDVPAMHVHEPPNSRSIGVA
jgi:two-component sensor histidine kinase